VRIGVIYLGRRGSGGPISFELASHLSKQASVFTLLSEQIEGLERWRQSGLEFFCIPTYRNLLGAVWSWLDRPRLKWLAAQVRRRQPDVLIYPMFYTLNPFLQQHLADIPSLVAVHDPLPHPGINDLVYKILEDRSIHQATRCLVFSRGFEADLQKRGLPPQKIDYLPHGDLSYYHQYRSQPVAEIPPEERNLLFFGRITTYKGLDVLLKAFRQVSHLYSIRLQVVGAGDTRPYRQLLEGVPGVQVVNRWIKEEEVDDYFRAARMVLLPYTSATQSGVLTIAASYGLPVVASRVGGIPEQIQDGKNGLLIDPNSVDQLAKAIQRLLENPEYAASLGQHLMREYTETRSWAKISRLVYSACEKALREPRVQSPAGS
jgi:glycosyltransferase involved in cell wall biosynthesis